MHTTNFQDNSSYIDMTGFNDRSKNLNKVIGPRKNAHCFCIHCGTCLSFFKWFPVIFISLILGWSYYAYVIQLCLITIDQTYVKIIYIFVFNCFYVMTIWSYFQTVVTKSILVPDSFWLTNEDYNRIMKETTNDGKKTVIHEISREKKLPLSCRTLTGSMRVCSKCNLIKPDRAHHCSVCNACILKMDHHCPWINNCVSFSNYKFFILFLGYSFVLCLFGSITSFPYFLMFWSNQLPALEKLDILFLFFISVMFSVSLFSLFLYHIYLILLNRSTLESFRTPLFTYGVNINAFNLGKLNNFKEVFGNEKILWPFPIYTSEDNVNQVLLNTESDETEDLSPNECSNVKVVNYDFGESENTYSLINL